MSEQPRDKIARIAVALAVLAFVSLGYFYSVAYRLDWIRYVTESYYWRVQTLVCPDKKPETVVILSEKRDAQPQHVVLYDPDLARYLKTLPADQPVKAEVMRKGYLWEWNYGEQFVLSIGTKGIYVSWRKIPEDLKGCAYGPVTNLDPNLPPGADP
jgi:hypothetical protein